MTMTEEDMAVIIAEAWLDGRMNSLTQMVPGDPDCDACVLARQYVRLRERSGAEKTVDTTKLNAGQLVQRIMRAMDGTDRPESTAQLAERIAAEILKLPKDYWRKSGQTDGGQNVQSNIDSAAPMPVDLNERITSP